MSDPANQLNVPTDAPVGKYRTPNVAPVFNTTSKNVTLGASGGAPVNSAQVVFGGIGKPISNVGG